MALLIETDIGRDLDDYLAICVLDAWGVDIAAISVTPGDHDQLALLGGLRKDLNQSWKIGPSIQGRNKRSLSGVHKGLRLFGITPDGWGPDLFQQELEKGPCDLFTIGPNAIRPTFTKALHDVVAAACYVDPAIGTWISGKTCRKDNAWGTQLDEFGDAILVDIDYDKFWNMVQI